MGNSWNCSCSDVSGSNQRGNLFIFNNLRQTTFRCKLHRKVTVFNKDVLCALTTNMMFVKYLVFNVSHCNSRTQLFWALLVATSLSFCHMCQAVLKPPSQAWVLAAIKAGYFSCGVPILLLDRKSQGSD